MKAEPVDPRDVSWEEDRPAYRVHFWSPGRVSSLGGVSWTSDEWRLTGVRDVVEVLDWAAEQSRGRRFELLLERPGESLGLVRLLGVDPTGIRIRRAAPSEADDVATLWLLARAAAVPAVPPPVHSEEEVRNWFRGVVFVEEEVWVAESDQLLGLLVLSEASVEQLYVEPRTTNWRIGSQLLEVAKDRRPHGLDLWTFEANEAARRFYERHGFAAVERCSSHSEEGAPDVRYRWAGDQGPPH